MADKPQKIFYIDETRDNCVIWLRETRESAWRIVNEVRASKGDRVILSDVEHIVEADQGRRRLRRGETHLWRTWDIPALGHVPDPVRIKTTHVDNPIKCVSMGSLEATPEKK